jgi:hypothetical protein
MMKKKLGSFAIGLLFFLSALFISVNAFAGPNGCNWGVSLVVVCWWPPHNDKITKFCDCSTTPQFEDIGGLCNQDS